MTCDGALSPHLLISRKNTVSGFGPAMKPFTPLRSTVCEIAWNRLMIGESFCSFFCRSMYISLRLAGSRSRAAASVSVVISWMPSVNQELREAIVEAFSEPGLSGLRASPRQIPNQSRECRHGPATR